MAVDAQPHVTRGGGNLLELARLDRIGRVGRREHDTAQAAGRGVMVTLRAGLDRLDHALERLGRRRHQSRDIECPRFGGAAAAEHQAQPQLLRHLEDDVRRIEAIALGEQIVVIGGGGRAGEEQLGKPDACRHAQRLLVDLVPEGVRHRAQPGVQRAVDPAANAFEDALEQMVMGRDETGIDHAARRIDDRFVRAWRQSADLGDAAVGDADRALRPHRRAGQAGEDALGALDQHHVSAPTSLSCHCPSASLDSMVMSVNRPTPASVMRKSAANMRGMSS